MHWFTNLFLKQNPVTDQWILDQSKEDLLSKLQNDVDLPLHSAKILIIELIKRLFAEIKDDQQEIKLNTQLLYTLGVKIDILTEKLEQESKTNLFMKGFSAISLQPRKKRKYVKKKIS